MAIFSVRDADDWNKVMREMAPAATGRHRLWLLLTAKKKKETQIACSAK